MGVGGAAEFFVRAASEDELSRALDWARSVNVPVRVLGGGSNVVVADGGVSGLVVQIALRGVEVRHERHAALVTAAAGEPWDDFVARTVAGGWAGLECLSGIPGSVGATPIQNVGAYGREIADCLESVRVLDRNDRSVHTLAPSECALSYRDSRFKSREPERFIVLAVTYRLTPGGAPEIRYAELQRQLEQRGINRPSIADVRATVLDVRRAKSMVLSSDDPNRRSCGSFFLNPILDADEAARVRARAASLTDDTLPEWSAGEGRVKLPAAWLIERAGFTKGERSGAVGLSSKHTLALVAHDGASASDVVAFARRIRLRVDEVFGVQLVPEPQFWGFASLDDGLPDDRLA